MYCEIKNTKKSFNYVSYDLFQPPRIVKCNFTSTRIVIKVVRTTQPPRTHKGGLQRASLMNVI